MLRLYRHQCVGTDGRCDTSVGCGGCLCVQRLLPGPAVAGPGAVPRLVSGRGCRIRAAVLQKCWDVGDALFLEMLF